MSAQQKADRDALTRLLNATLQTGNAAELERYLTEHSALPGPRMNTALLTAFAEVIGDLLIQSEPPENLETLVDRWAALSLENAPVNDPREILPAAAVRAYGQAAISRPEWWPDEIAKLHNAAQSPRWRTREIVAVALQSLLAADWDRTYAILLEWLTDTHPLVIRASAAAIAEPPLLTTPQRGNNALTIQTQAVEWFSQIPAQDRRNEDVRTLRKALGFTVSVAVAAAPDAGFELLNTLAASNDTDIQWIVRETLKKNRLAKWPDRVAEVTVRLS